MKRKIRDGEIFTAFVIGYVDERGEVILGLFNNLTDARALAAEQSHPRTFLGRERCVRLNGEIYLLRKADSKICHLD